MSDQTYLPRVKSEGYEPACGICGAFVSPEGCHAAYEDRIKELEDGIQYALIRTIDSQTRAQLHALKKDD